MPAPRAPPTSLHCRSYNCTAANLDGLPICFSWPVLPSSISKDSFLMTLSNGTKVRPTAAAAWGSHSGCRPACCGRGVGRMP